MVDVEEESCIEFYDNFKSDSLLCCSSSGDDLEDCDLKEHLEDNLENDSEDDC